MYKQILTFRICGRTIKLGGFLVTTFFFPLLMGFLVCGLGVEVERRRGGEAGGRNAERQSGLKRQCHCQLVSRC